MSYSLKLKPTSIYLVTHNNKLELIQNQFIANEDHLNFLNQCIIKYNSIVIV